MYNWMTIQVRLRKWGNSVGIVIPAEVLKEKDLEEDEDVLVEISKKNSIEDLFGSLKKWKINAQKEKEILRREWE